MSLLLMLLSLQLSAAPRSPAVADRVLTAYPASDERIQVMGRHMLEENGSVVFAASGVTFFMRFSGASLAIELEDEFRDGGHYNWFTVVLDDGAPARFRTEPGQTRYVLADDLPAGEHVVVLSKATEGQNGWSRLRGVETEKLLPASPPPERRIEFIGDSITCGYGLDDRQVACEEGSWFDQTHAWLSFAPRLARRLDAQWMLTAVAGIGMHRNWNSLSPVMPDIYGGVFADYADSTSSWDFGRYRPDLVVIALGTNDFSSGGEETPRVDLDGRSFVADYVRFVERVRQHYPQARLLLVNSPTLGPEQRTRLAAHLQEVIEARAAAGDDAIAAFTYDGHYGAGCASHPDLEEHIRMTDELEPAVRALMGW